MSCFQHMEDLKCIFDWKGLCRTTMITKRLDLLIWEPKFVVFQGKPQVFVLAFSKFFVRHYLTIYVITWRHACSCFGSLWGNLNTPNGGVLQKGPVVISQLDWYFEKESPFATIWVKHCLGCVSELGWSVANIGHTVGNASQYMYLWEKNVFNFRMH